MPTRGIESGSTGPGQLRIRHGKPIITPVGRQPGLDEGSHSGPAPLPEGGLATIGFLPGKHPNGLHYQVVVVDALTKGTARSALVTGMDSTSTKTLRYARGLLPAANQIGTDPVVLGLSL